MSRSALWIPLAWTAMHGAWLLVFAERFDGTELRTLAAALACGYAGLAALDVVGRRRRRAREAETPEGVGGPTSTTTYLCLGEPRTVTTQSPPGTSLEDHLAQHAADVVADAEANGCADEDRA